MKTKYGSIPDEMVREYVEGMRGKIFKILPMKEKNSPTLHKYIKATLRELMSHQEVVYVFKNDQNFLSIINIVNSLLDQTDMDVYRSDFFKAMRLIDRLNQLIDGDMK